MKGRKNDRMTSLCDAQLTETQPIDLSSLLKGIPAGAWVALSHDHTHVVAFSADMRSAFEEAHSRGEHAPVMFRIPEQPSVLFL